MAFIGQGVKQTYPGTHDLDPGQRFRTVVGAIVVGLLLAIQIGIVMFLFLER